MNDLGIVGVTVTGSENVLPIRRLLYANRPRLMSFDDDRWELIDKSDEEHPLLFEAVYVATKDERFSPPFRLVVNSEFGPICELRINKIIDEIVLETGDSVNIEFEIILRCEDMI